MKKFIAENKLAVAAIIFDILTIAAIVVCLASDLSAWIAIVLGFVAVILNTVAKKRQKEKFKSQ